MRGLKGQLSVEFTAVLASMLLILVLLVVIFSGVYAQQELHTQYIMASHAVSVLSTQAKSVWIEGKDTYAYSRIDIPPSAQLENSSIGNNSLNLYVSHFGDAFEITSFNTSGWWPNQTGSVIMSVRNNGSHVLIRPAFLFSLSPLGVYTSSGNSAHIINITNNANESFRLSKALVFVSCPSCSYDGGGTHIIVSGDSYVSNLTFTPASNQITSGYIQINASPLSSSSDIENVSIIIPLTAVR